MITLLAHSMMMFYLIGKGKAVKDAMAEHQVAGDYYRRIASARKPVFSIATLAMAATMVAAIHGASVDTRVLPPIVHAMIAYGAIACNVAALKTEISALSISSGVVDEVNRQIRIVTPAVLELSGVVKDYRALRPLRIAALSVQPGEHVALVGFDQVAAEVFTNLVTGAILPETGDIRVFGRPTSAIADSDDWLATVDRFGIVSERAVLLDQLSVLQNLAMPFTLEIEPPPDEVKRQASVLAHEVGLPESIWEQPIAALPPASRVRLRLGRGPGARSARVDPGTCQRRPVGGRSRRAGRRYPRASPAGAGTAIVAATLDEAFGRAVADRILRWQPATGQLAEQGTGRWFRRLLG